MKTMTIELTTAQIDELLDCDGINIGGTIFIKRSVVIEALVEYRHKTINKPAQQQEIKLANTE